MAGDDLKEQVDTLRRAYAAFTVRHDFRPGDVVRWKPHLCNRNLRPPAVVVEVLARTVPSPTKDSGYQTFGESYDVVLGHVDKEGIWRLVHVDSRRLEPLGGASPLAKVLQGACREFLTRHRFLPGQTVRWKDGMRNRDLPETLVAVGMLDEPVLNPSDDVHDPLFREPVDLMVAMTRDDTLFVYHVDSRRLIPADGDPTPALAPVG